MEISFNTDYGNLILLDNDMFITSSFKRNEYWEISTLLSLKKYINPNKNILEIGGHCGTSTLVYASFLDDGKYHVYEPQKKLFDILNKNIVNNNLSNRVFPLNKGVFCYNGKANMNDIDIDGDQGNPLSRYNEEKSLPCNFGGISLGKDGEDIEVVTIDSMCLDNLGFIHCDAQGSEPFIMFGGQKTIRENRPVILYENSKFYEDYLYKKVSESYPNFSEEGKFDIKKFCMEELNYSSFIDRCQGGIDTLLIP